MKFCCLANQLLIGTGLILACGQYIHAQNAPVTTVGSVVAVPASEVTVPFTVTGFSNIGSLSLHIDFDPRVLTYLDAVNILPGLSGIMVNDNHVSDTLHKIMATWSSVTPLNLADGTHLFDLKFLTLSGITWLTFNNEVNHGIECEYSNAAGNPLNDLPTSTFYVNGQVSVFTVPAVFDIPFATINNGETNCYNASQTLTAGGIGKTFTVQSGGTATLIAGSNIRILPGSRIYQGGKLHGYITTTENYCLPASIPSVLSSFKQAMEPATAPDIPLACKVFPNPTTGKFTVESSFAGSGGIRITIHSVTGEKLYDGILPASGKIGCSLEKYPEGIYLLNVVRENESEVKKIIILRR